MANNAPLHVPVPASTARAVHVQPGQHVRVTDTHGGQVGDVFVVVADNPGEHLSAAHTRLHVNRLFPRPGEQFVTTARRPILRLVEDTSPGYHDMLVPACDPARYRQLGAPEGHPSCAMNLRDALEAYDAHGSTGAGLPAGAGRDAVPAVPQPVNVFMRVPVADDGTISLLSAMSGPGDAITFEAELDCLVVVSACPQDLSDINQKQPTSLAIDVLDSR
ncbi:urea carboxylase-associated family protein [Actinobacteria bacterium YIM 96077]|uniref:Urea carboxylase-related aminomethyltransferase n=1 Tax=Phytoactinopolyspora halophila TaxID=1981511 RepID=A0A329QXL0_9ACTN|nr:urea carboxylase-associated family protein [Phytoactinopolyspora halophila]AYY12757.1 urea carboxylase-associated family protein [Actinobacteria bacterium YIM 96077]RAW16449.1 Urea carboxylase-related aminomethyltransferase [Phytoactinopolyspora halophila]